MSDKPPFDAQSIQEGPTAGTGKAERGRVERPSVEAFSLVMAKTDRDNARASTVPVEYAKMTLDELARVIAASGNSPQSYAARVEMDRRVAQAQIDAAIAQRDAANAQKRTSWAAWVFVPAALMGVVIGWLLARLMGLA